MKDVSVDKGACLILGENLEPSLAIDRTGGHGDPFLTAESLRSARSASLADPKCSEPIYTK